MPTPLPDPMLPRTYASDGPGVRSLTTYTFDADGRLVGVDGPRPVSPGDTWPYTPDDDAPPDEPHVVG